jgi:ABC-2 type transport system permease protein
VQLQRVITLASRVFKQITRDRRTLGLMFIVPLIVLALAGVLLKSQPENIPLGVVNEDAGFEAPEPLGHISLADLIAQQLRDSQAFAVIDLHPGDVDAALKAGRVKGAIIFGEDFTQAIVTGNQARVQLRLEGSNPTTVANIRNQVSRIVLEEMASMASVAEGFASVLSEGGSPAAAIISGPPILVEPSFLYGGPRFDSLDYIAPVYIAFFAFFFVFLLTCVFFLRERSLGTMERLLATPINRLEIVLGYMLGLGLFALLQSAVVLLFTVFALRIDYAGNLLVVFLVQIMLTMLAANMGILASTFASNEFQVVQFIPLVIFPQMLLSGMIWAVEELPTWLQPLSTLMPMTYANRAMRDVMIKGEGLAGIWLDLLIVAAFAAIFVGLGALTVRREIA